MQQAAEATLETGTDTDTVVNLSWCLVLLEPQLSPLICLFAGGGLS